MQKATRKRSQRSARKRDAKKSESKSKTKVSTTFDDTHGEVREGVFHPSSKQVEFMEALVQFEGKRVKIAQLCKAVKMSRQAYYKWCKEPEFVKWQGAVRNRLFEIHMPFVDKVVLNKSLAGDLRAAKLAYEKRGELYNRMGVDFSGSVAVVTDPAKLAEMEEALSRMKV